MPCTINTVLCGFELHANRDLDQFARQIALYIPSTEVKRGQMDMRDLQVIHFVQRTRENVYSLTSCTNINTQRRIR
jgi:hypothetical protein